MHDKKRYRAFMTSTLTVQPTATATQIDRSGAGSDARLVELWLAGRSPHTQRAYAADVSSALAAIGRPLVAVTVADLVDWISGLAGSPATRARRVAAVKSLLSYGRRVGYLTFDVGAAVRAPAVPNQLAQRIMPESAVLAMIGSSAGRDRAVLRLLYVAGLRASELTALDWEHLAKRGEGGQVTVVAGKGGKTRTVLMTATCWAELEALRPAAAQLDNPVFVSRSGKRLEPSAVWRLVRRAAAAAGLDQTPSPHWLRHAHASHALDRGAPISLVQQTLGHSSVATTGRYLHARPGASSGTYLVE